MIGHTIIGRGNRRVLVLHGWLGDWTVFAPMLPAIDLDRFCFAFMDYRGFGRSIDMEGEYSLVEIARDALSLADHLGWQQFSLLGHSMGGAAALRVAVDARSRVQKIGRLLVVSVPTTVRRWRARCDNSKPSQPGRPDRQPAPA